MSLESLYWKLEPCSPQLGPDSPSEWSLLDFDDEKPVVEDAPAVVPSRSDLAQQLLDDIEEFVKKEEPFTDWYEDKVHLPIFDEIQPVTLPITMEATSPITTLQTLQAFLPKDTTELSYVLGHGHLTPPQSPPAIASPTPQPIFIVQQEPVAYNTFHSEPTELIPEPYVLAPPSPDLVHEMAVVDEVVRGAAQQWEQWESSDSNSRCSESTEDSDDPEWMPEEAPTLKATARRSRQRPYNPTDRRMRKKEQNKNAATRYRQKKKAEVNVIVEEERKLEDEHATLETKITDIQREITYLKGIMRDVFRAKGLMK